MLIPPRLDDIAFENLRKLAQDRIAAASDGRWTHHAPVDPGITLLELFAFLLDQQLYRLDQTPAALDRAILTLLGEAPRPAATARTVLVLTAADAAVPPASFVLPAGTLVQPDAPGLEAIAFTTADRIAVLPGAIVAVQRDGHTFPAGEVFRPFAADNGAGAIDIRVTLPGPLPPLDAPLSLFLDLETAGDIPPAWSAEAADVAPPATLSFATRTGAGFSALPAASLSDGTGGLRRPGLLRVAWSPAWTGASEIVLRIATDAASFAAPPRLRGVHVNAVVAEHRSPCNLDHPQWAPVRAELAAAIAGWLPLSGTTLALPPALGAVLEGSIDLAIERRGSWIDFRQTADLAFAGPDDAVFTLDRATGVLAFGDGLNGRVPGPATDFRLTLASGGGRIGNLPAGMPWLPPVPGMLLQNPVPASGGAEAETPADAIARAAIATRGDQRVVTAADIAAFVTGFPGLGGPRVHVAEGLDPAFPCVFRADAVTVFVVPRVPRAVAADIVECPAPALDPGALATLAAALGEARMLGTRLHVRRPRIRPVALAVAIEGLVPGDIAAGLHERLAQYLDPLVGGADGRGWPFGRALRPSELARVVEQALGPGALVASMAIGIDGAAASEACADTPIGPNDLVWLAALSVTGVAP